MALCLALWPDLCAAAIDAQLDAAWRAAIDLQARAEYVPAEERLALLRQCSAILGPLRPKALASRDGQSVYFVATVGAECRFLVRTLEGKPPNFAEVIAELAPFDPVMSAAEHVTPWSAARRLDSWMSVARVVGLAADPEAVSWYMGQVSDWAQRVANHADDTEAATNLAELVKGTYGRWQMQEEVLAMQRLLQRELGEHHRHTLWVMRSVAYHERFLGHPQQALQVMDRADRLARHHWPEDRMFLAHMGAELASCMASAGRTSEALKRLSEVRATFVELQPQGHANLARIDNNLASMSIAIGDFKAGVFHGISAVHHAKASGLPGLQGEARLYQANAEWAQLKLGDATAAPALLAMLSRVIHEHEAHAGPPAFGLVEFAVRSADQALLQAAIQVAVQHIREYRGPMQPEQALVPLMQAWQSAGLALADAAVRPLLDESLTVALTGRSTHVLALAQFNLARHVATRDADTAIWLYKRSANAMQLLRQGLPDDQPELHRAWLGAHEDDLRRFIELLIDNGRLLEAEQALSNLRDEEAHEFTRRSLRRVASQTRPLSYTETEAQRNARLQQVADAVRVVSDRADARLQGLRIQQHRHDYEDPETRDALRRLVAEAAHAVDERPALRGSIEAWPDRSAPTARQARVHTMVRMDSVAYIVQVGDTIHQINAPLPGPELNRLVQLARSRLASPALDPVDALRSLHGRLFAPLEPLLRRHGITRIDWVPDGVLRYLPLGVLHDGRKYLAQRFDITTRWTSGRTEAVDSGKAKSVKASGTIVAFGRSVGDTEHAALPAVQDELRALSRRGARTWLDQTFTADQLRQSVGQRPTVVHLASHFVLDPASEAQSYLLLGDGSRMPLADLAGLPWQGVDTVVLSGCDTGLPAEGANGLASTGFAQVLQQAGVQRVLASMWPVSDAAGAQLTESLYAARRGNTGAPTLRDLARAQRQWLQRHERGPLAHPHYWGAYVWLDGSRK